MHSQGNPREVGVGSANAAAGGNPPVAVTDSRAQRPPFPHVPFFLGIPTIGSQLPFFFPPPYVPPIPEVGIAPTIRGGPAAPIDLTTTSGKRGPEECVSTPVKVAKKRKKPKKPVPIVELDDVKDDVETPKTGCLWKDHWVIQLIAIRGEMHNIFSAPPKQGVDNWSRLHMRICLVLKSNIRLVWVYRTP